MVGTFFSVLCVMEDFKPTFLSWGQGWSLILSVTVALPLFVSVLLREAASSQEGLAPCSESPPSPLSHYVWQPYLLNLKSLKSKSEWWPMRLISQCKSTLFSPLIYMDLSLALCLMRSPRWPRLHHCQVCPCIVRLFSSMPFWKWREILSNWQGDGDASPKGPPQVLQRHEKGK